MRSILVAAVITLLPAGAVLAQELQVDRSKVYASSPEGCKKLETSGAEIFSDMDFLALTFDQGIQGMEFHCHFYDVKEKANGNFLLVEAVCEFPGQRYPDLLSVTPYDENSIEVVSLYDTTTLEATEANPNPGTSIYARCSIDHLPTE